MTINPKIETLLAKAWSKRGKEQYVEAQTLVEKALELCQEGDFNYLGRIFHIYAQFESDHNHPQKALEFLRKSLFHYEKYGNPNKIAHSTRHIADIQRRLGRHAASEKNYQQVLNIYRSDANTRIGDLANALRGYGLLLEQRGKITEAISAWQEAKEGYSAINLQEGVIEASEKIDLLLGLNK